MTFQYSRCIEGLSFWPDLEIPVRSQVFKDIKAGGVSWVGLTCTDTVWDMIGWQEGFTGARFPGVTSWVEQANAISLRTVVRGCWWAQNYPLIATQPDRLDEPVLQLARSLVDTSPYMNAFQPVAEWALPATPENAALVAGWNARIAPKIRAILPRHTIVFSPPAWGHFSGFPLMPKLPDLNACWGADLYSPSDEPEGVAAWAAWLSSRKEKGMIIESGLQDRSDLTLEPAKAEAFRQAADPLQIPCAAFRHEL